MNTLCILIEQLDLISMILICSDCICRKLDRFRYSNELHLKAQLVKHAHVLVKLYRAKRETNLNYP